MNKKILQQDYTPIYGGRQVVIPFDYEIKIPEDDPVVLLCEEMERLDYTSCTKHIPEMEEVPRFHLKSCSCFLYLVT